MTPTLTIFLTQSAHTDIGYTHPQEQIGLLYLDHYDKVLDLCQRTESAPETQRFKWTCETAWQVRNYLTAHPQRTEEFLHYVKNGQIEVTAAYLHFTDLIDADAYARSLDWAVNFCREHDLPLRCAMHADINGWAWALPDLLAERGIPYFGSAVHIDSATDPLGQRGSVHYHWLVDPNLAAWLRPDTPVRIPQPFWWQGPQGHRVLHWLGEHYHLGNFLGLSGKYNFPQYKTRRYGAADRMTADELYATAKVLLSKYVERLRRDGYALDILHIYTSGLFIDNSAPDGRWCDIVARWNADHDDVKLRTATLSEWFETLANHDSSTWPVRQVAWPDHWAHGLGTMTRRIAQARRTQRRRPGVMALVKQSNSAEAASFLDTALDQERLSLEHTFSAWMTTAIPHDPYNEYLSTAKGLYFHRAELYLSEAAGSALQTLFPEAAESPRLFVEVPSQQAANTRYSVHFDSSDQILDPAAQVLVDSEGHHFPFQRESMAKARPEFVAALPLSARRLNSFRVVPASSHTAESASPPPTPSTVLESAAWRLRIDPETGTLTSLMDLTNGKEWIDSGRSYGFGQLVHERVVHPRGRDAVGNMARMIALDVASDELRRYLDAEPVFERQVPTFENLGRVSGTVFDALTVEGTLTNYGSVRATWRVYHDLPLVEFVLDWEKSWCDLPEAAYVVFPFAGPFGQVQLETAGGFFTPGYHGEGGQLAGTASSYYTIQRAAHITASPGVELLWLPLDAPLAMTNDIHFNYWEPAPYSWNGFLASMPVNHYWHTNFPTSQRGYLRSRYRFINALGFVDREAAIQASLSVEALGWQ